MRGEKGVADGERKVVVVSGDTAQVEACASELRRRGHHVVTVSRDPDRPSPRARACGRGGRGPAGGGAGGALPFEDWIRSRSGGEAAVEPGEENAFEEGWAGALPLEGVARRAERVGARMMALINEVGYPDALVNCEGEALAGAVEDTSSEEAQRQIERSLLSVHYLVRIAVPMMRMRGEGLIVNVAPSPEAVGFFGWSRAVAQGLQALTDALAREVEPSGLRAVCVPMAADAPLVEARRGRTPGRSPYWSDYERALLSEVGRAGHKSGGGGASPQASGRWLAGFVERALVGGGVSHGRATKALADSEALAEGQAAERPARSGLSGSDGGRNGASGRPSPPGLRARRERWSVDFEGGWREEERDAATKAAALYEALHAAPERQSSAWVFVQRRLGRGMTWMASRTGFRRPLVAGSAEELLRRVRLSARQAHQPGGPARFGTPARRRLVESRSGLWRS